MRWHKLVISIYRALGGHKSATQNISANWYVLQVSHLNFVNFVSSDINEKKLFFFFFYMDKFDKNSFKAGDWRTSNSRTLDMKTGLHFKCYICQKIHKNLRNMSNVKWKYRAMVNMPEVKINGFLFHSLTWSGFEL